MNKKKVLLVVLALVIGLVLAGCKSDDESSSGGGISVGLPGNVAPSDLQGYLSKAGKDAGAIDAKNLLVAVTNNVGNISYVLNQAEQAVLYSFKNELTNQMNDKVGANLDRKSVDVSKNDISDSDVFKNLLNGDVGKAKISGSQSGSISSNQKIRDLYPPYLHNEGDSLSTSVSGRRTFEITQGFAEITDYYSYPTNTYYFAGYITVEYSNSESDTLVEEDIFNREYSDNGTTRTVAVALTLADKNNDIGAKFLFSAADTSAYAVRGITQSSAYSYSDIEVYDRDNRLITTIPSDEISIGSWLGLSSIIGYRFDQIIYSY